ncbi:uncharacterized protein SCHCODRAFT_02554005, partial [Schizophyllum commune H4-8]
MTVVLSQDISTCRNMHSLPVTDFRLVDLDPGLYRRQIEHFEYYWGLEKGQVDLASSLNHVELRQDMAEKLEDCDWVIIPTQEIIRTVHALAEYNMTAGLRARKNILRELGQGPFEYEFVPLYLLQRRPQLFVDDGSRIKAKRAPYKAMPCLRSLAHPLFVIWFASMQLDSCAALVMEEDRARALMDSVGNIVMCWLEEPPEEFLVGQDVWRQHRHPLSDDGHEAVLTLGGENTRRTTRALCKQRKTGKVARPYARLDPRSPNRRCALPRPGTRSDDEQGSTQYTSMEHRAWLDGVARETNIDPTPHNSLSTEDETRQDVLLAGYREEIARDAADALNPSHSVLLSSGLIIGNGLDWSGYSSNNWAMRVHGICLLGKEPFGKGS